MQFEYNGNLLEEDRINLVANEILSVYPQIGLEKAKKVAMLEGTISTEKNLDMYFNRLYNIMLITSDNKDIVKLVYSDLINILNNNQNYEKIDYYHSILFEIAEFLENKREFPLLDEF